MDRNKHNTYRMGFWCLPDPQLVLRHPTCHTRHMTREGLEMGWQRSQMYLYVCKPCGGPVFEVSSESMCVRHYRSHRNLEKPTAIPLIEKLPLVWDFELYIMPLILLDRYTGLETSAFTIVFTAACQRARRLQFTPPYIVSLKKCLQYLTSSYFVKYNNKSWEKFRQTQQW